MPYQCTSSSLKMFRACLQNPGSSADLRCHLINNCYAHSSADGMCDTRLASLGSKRLYCSSEECFPLGQPSDLPTSQVCCVAQMRRWMQKNYINSKTLYKCEKNIIIFISSVFINFQPAPHLALGQGQECSLLKTNSPQQIMFGIRQQQQAINQAAVVSGKT